MNFLDEAKLFKEELVRWRRYLHQNAEVGCELPKTTAFVLEELKKLGYAPKEICQSGVSATIGKEGKTILLRADMDALPMKEMSNLEFASPNESAAHTCGHDLHAAALLGAARLLKVHEGELNGTVKLMFQPGEEIFQGSRAMIEAGIMENPRVDAAFAGHVTPRYQTGVIACRKGAAMASCYGFKVKIYGKATHGACPDEGIDPINIGVHIYLALQELIAREVNFQKGAILTVGRFHAGAAANNIPQEAELSGTLRTFDSKVREHLIARIGEVADRTAGAYRGRAEIEELSNVPVEINDAVFTEQVQTYIRELCGAQNLVEDILMTGSEDFANISGRVPSLIVFIGALAPNHEGEVYSGHHPKVVFDEAVLPVSAALYADTAVRWLKDQG